MRRNGTSICRNGEGFVKVEGVKFLDTFVAIDEKGLSLEQCKAECLRNCSYMAYAITDVRNGGSGCWHGMVI